MDIATVIKEENAHHDFTTDPDGDYEILETIKVFDVNKLQADSAGLILGPRRSGKTYLMKHLLKERLRFVLPQFVFLTKTGLLSNTWSIAPRSYVLDAHDTDTLKKIIGGQLMNVEKMSEKLYRDSETRWDSTADLRDALEMGIGLIGDDLMGMDSLHSDKVVEQMYTSGRHMFIAPWVLGQAPKMLGPNVRGNTDYAFIFKFRNHLQATTVVEDFNLGKHPLEAQLIYDTLLQREHDTVVVSMTAPPGEPNIWKYRAPENEDFKFVVGSKMYWQNAHEIPPKNCPLPEDISTPKTKEKENVNRDRTTKPKKERGSESQRGKPNARSIPTRIGPIEID